jgi:hypothetical protein
MAQEVGHDWDKLSTVGVTGVGRGRAPAKLGSLPIRLGTVELSIRCLFMDQRVAPFILGCADVLDRFAVTIDVGQGKIIFTEIGWA